MELRSCSHLHFIQAVKGGLVTKVLNVYRGKPALKFKVVKDLCVTEETKNLDSVAVFRPKVELEDVPIECDGLPAENLYLLREGSNGVKSEETSESSSTSGDNGANELDDLVFGNITLKQFKESCKKRKRKCSRYVDLNKGTGTCSVRNQDHFSPKSGEDEYDIMEPLSCWKSRILKKKKAEKMCIRSSVSTACQNSLSIAKFQENPNDRVIFQYSENFPVPIAIKVEVSEPCYSSCKDLIIYGEDSSFSCNDPLIRSGILPYEENTVDQYDLEINPETSIRASDDPESAKYCVLETGMSKISSEEVTTSGCGFENQMPTWCSDEPQLCAFNEQSYEYVKHAEPKSITGVQASDREAILENSEKEIIGEDIAEVISHQFSELSIVAIVNKEDSVTDQHPKSNFSETVSPCNYLSPVMYYDPCVHQNSKKSSSYNQVQVPDVTVTENLQHMELGKRNGPCLLQGKAKDDMLHAEDRILSRPDEKCSSPSDSELCPRPKVSAVSVPDYSPTSEEKRSPSSVGSDPARNFCSEAHSCIDEPVISARVKDCHSKPRHPPERLFSTRMAISPTSQKRLREALECTALDAEQYYKYARTLCYRKQNESKIGRSEWSNQMKKAEVTISPKKVVRKPKVDNNGFHQNDKVPYCAAQRFSTGCTSVRSCSESAIVFSQQQMRDIKSITAKLAKELQTMKDIVEETLQSKLCPATSVKYDAEEIRMSIQNATKVEESARKSLSIMARDTDRFCKIMKLVEKVSVPSPNVVRKKRKIVFADEAGGKLCDVKTFEDDVSSLTVPEDENTVTVD